MKFSKLIEGFLLDKKLSLSANTVETYGYYFDSVIGYLDDPEFETITSLDIRRYLNWIVTERGLSKRSAHDRYSVLSSLYSWAVKELGTPNIMKNVAKPKYTKRVIESFIPAELSTLVSNLDGEPHRFKALLLVLLDSGLRVSELCNLEVRDYTTGNGRIFVRSGKGDKDRIVFIGTRARKALWRYLAERTIESQKEPLFATANLTKLTRNNVRRDLARYAKPFGIKSHPHKFRHTFAVNFLRNGGNVRQLQTILGHEKLDMIMTYTKLAEIDLEAARVFSPVDNL